MIAHQRDLFGVPLAVNANPTAQLPLPLGWHQRSPSSAPPFLVGESNRDAAAYINASDDWLIPVALLVGPRQSGRSTLAQRFADATCGRVIDDAERYDERALFHAWNTAVASGAPLLLVADRAVAAWTVTIPDLATRLAAVPTVAIGAPDLALMAALIDQGLAVHGISCAANVGRFIAERIERSYVAAHAAVEALQRDLLRSGDRPTTANVRATLAASGLLTQSTAAPPR
jgi:hypothetical protein